MVSYNPVPLWESKRVNDFSITMTLWTYFVVCFPIIVLVLSLGDIDSILLILIFCFLLLVVFYETYFNNSTFKFFEDSWCIEKDEFLSYDLINYWWTKRRKLYIVFFDKKINRLRTLTIHDRTVLKVKGILENKTPDAFVHADSNFVKKSLYMIPEVHNKYAMMKEESMTIAPFE